MEWSEYQEKLHQDCVFTLYYVDEYNEKLPWAGLENQHASLVLVNHPTKGGFFSPIEKNIFKGFDDEKYVLFSTGLKTLQIPPNIRGFDDAFLSKQVFTLCSVDLVGHYFTMPLKTAKLLIEHISVIISPIITFDPPIDRVTKEQFDQSLQFVFDNFLSNIEHKSAIEANTMFEQTIKSLLQQVDFESFLRSANSAANGGLHKPTMSIENDGSDSGIAQTLTNLATIMWLNNNIVQTPDEIYNRYLTVHANCLNTILLCLIYNKSWPCVNGMGDIQSYFSHTLTTGFLLCLLDTTTTYNIMDNPHFDPRNTELMNAYKCQLGPKLRQMAIQKYPHLTTISAPGKVDEATAKFDFVSAIVSDFSGYFRTNIEDLLSPPSTWNMCMISWCMSTKERVHWILANYIKNFNDIVGSSIKSESGTVKLLRPLTADRVLLALNQTLAEANNYIFSKDDNRWYFTNNMVNLLSLNNISNLLTDSFSIE